MTRSPQTTAKPWTETYSEIIDVRSPAEYAADHLPGAINLPVLDNTQRAEVGTIYTQVSPFQARKLGASYVSANISQHLAHHFADKAPDYAPLIYCWRGGQRSRSLALVLGQIGWLVTLLDGGYKTYRAWVRSQLVTRPTQLQFRVLCGMTGTGKTQLLQRLAELGGQVLDLESLANHRGSLLGQEWHQEWAQTEDAAPTPQPSQKYFETQILAALQHFDPVQPIWVESESSKIGKVYVPVQLWNQIKAAPGLEIELPLAMRVQALMADYPHLIAHPEFLKGKLERLRSRYGSRTLNQWFAWIDTGDWSALVANLLTHHYDPAYGRSLQQNFPQITTKLPLANLSKTEVERAITHLQRLTQM
ncbi:MAG: tRNA 2-selenouridine(34) synthase MnmH [Cyanobacteria bacterium P01_G01_bin.54]